MKNKINKKVLQFGPGRTGTTLIWQILKKIVKKAGKEHTLNELSEYDYVVITYRDFRDSLISGVIVNYNNLTVKNIKKTFEWYEKYLIELNNSKKIKKPVLYLKYENFYNNFDFIFNRLENFLDIKIKKELRLEIEKECNIEKNKKISKKYNNFSGYDKKTQIHGKHINNPEPGYWKTLSYEKQNILNRLLNKYLEEWGYKK